MATRSTDSPQATHSEGLALLTKQGMTMHQPPPSHPGGYGPPPQSGWRTVCSSEATIANVRLWKIAEHGAGGAPELLAVPTGRMMRVSAWGRRESANREGDRDRG